MRRRQQPSGGGTSREKIATCGAGVCGLQVAVEGGGLGEALVAVLADVRTFTCMRASVGHEVGRSCKSHVTLGALVRLLSRVDPAMLYQNTRPAKCCTTVVAFVDIVNIMTLHVHLQAVSIAKSLRTGRASERLIVGMLLPMPRQVALLVEGCPAVLTLERPFPGVSSSMDSQV